MDKINEEGFLRGFAPYLEAKRKQALYLKLFFASVTVLAICVLYFAYSIVDRASDKILVVNTGGQFLPVETTELDELYKTLLSAHCYSVAYYVNSFDVNNIKNNQARAAFLVSQADLNAVYAKYQHDNAYLDAINRGVVYRCEFAKIESLKQLNNGGEYEVVFTSMLSVMDNRNVKQFKIISKGTAIRVTPRFPENPTGFYFKNYIQEYYEY